MGGSSRPGDYGKVLTAEESIDYFVEYMERWRKSMGNLDDFYLAGHSYGGYLVGNYASKYHKHIKKLLLLSPLGVNSDFKKDDPDFIMAMMKRGNHDITKESKFHQTVIKMGQKFLK